MTATVRSPSSTPPERRISGLTRFYIIFFEMDVLYFAGPVLLNSRVPAPKLGWASFGLMVVGSVMTEVIMWMGKADVLLSSYIPLRAHPLYYPGDHALRGGALLTVGLFFASLVVARRERTYEGSVPRCAVCSPPVRAVRLLVW